MNITKKQTKQMSNMIKKTSNHSNNTFKTSNATFIKIPKKLVLEMGRLFPKDDIGLKYIYLLSNVDCVFGIRKFKQYTSLAIPGHIHRNLNFVKCNIFNLDKQVLRMTIEKYLQQLENLQYIEFYLDDSIYKRSIYDIPSPNSTMISIVIRDYTNTMEHKPIIHTPPKVKNFKKQHLHSSGLICYKEGIIRTYYDYKLKKTKYDYKTIPSNIKTYHYTTPQKWIPLIKAPFDRRAAVLMHRRNTINKCERTKQQAQKFSKCEAFLDLLVHSVKNDPNFVNSKNKNIVVFDDNETTSFRKLACRWHWDKKTVANFFKDFSAYFEPVIQEDRSGVVIFIKCLA